VPALPGALELAGAGVESTLAPENRKLLPGVGADARTALLLDPQTSGGLLAGIPAERAEACVSALRMAGIEASNIGLVESGSAAIRLHSISSGC
jgi:selenide,water dikinase